MKEAMISKGAFSLMGGRICLRELWVSGLPS